MAPTVLFRLPPVSGISGNHKYVLLNPLRDRSPESTALQFFEILKSGNCQIFSSIAPDLRLADDVTCDELHKIVTDIKHLGVLDQRLRDRIDNGNATSLWFSSDGYAGNQVMLKKHGEQWQVTGFWHVW